MKVGYESAIGSHVGMVRNNNQDSGYAGNRLFLVADGMGGHAGGDVASAKVTLAIAHIDELLQPAGSPAAADRNLLDEHRTGDTQPQPDTQPQADMQSPADAQLIPAPDAMSPEQHPVAAPPTQALPVTHNPATQDAAEAAAHLADTLVQANRMLRATVGDRPELAGLGTTFTGFITVDDKLALAHIGDSRLYLFRGGKLTQVTKDHTFVQKLVDSGRISEEEAKTHPRRSVLMRVLGDVESSPEVDTEVLDTEPGDVWLLCSDGLCGYVDEHEMEKILRRRTSLQDGVNDLIERSLMHGAPDNVTVVLVETTPSLEGGSHPGTPRYAGSAATEKEAERRTGAIQTPGKRRGMRRAQAVEESHFEPKVDEYLNELIAETKRRNRRRRALAALGLFGVIAVLVGGMVIAYQWTQTLYYVGTDGNTVIIYRGVQQSLGSWSLSSVAENTEIPLSDLAGIERRQIERTLSAGSIEEARDIVTRLGVTSND